MASSPKSGLPEGLLVSLGNVPVGTILRLAGGRCAFAFAESFVDMPSRPILSLSMLTPSGQLAQELQAYTGRLPPFFSNLLPEGALRECLADLAGVRPTQEFALLATLGADLPGAVTALPAGQPSMQGTDIPQTARVAPANGGRVLRFSLAGVQLKFSALQRAGGAMSVPATGVGGDWILKLPSPSFHALPENEFVVMTLARRVGIPVPELRLVAVEDVSGLPDGMAEGSETALAVRRFDRSAEGGRIHMEDFAQVFGRFPDGKYDGHTYANIASVLVATAGQSAAMDFARRLVFSVITGNGDMHLKNWSVLYGDPLRPTLSPAYDLLSTRPYLPKDRLALRFGDSNLLRGITPDRVRRFADDARLPVAPLLRLTREVAERTRDAWENHEARGLLPAWIDAAMERTIRTLAEATLTSGGPGDG